MVHNFKNLYDDYWSKLDINVLRERKSYWKEDIALFVNVINELSFGKTGTILDFGCGNGLLGAAIKEKVPCDLYMCDISENAIILAKSRVPDAICCAIESECHLPYKSNFFDIIYSNEVIEHCFDTKGMFREFYRILKPQGKLILKTPYHGLLKNLIIALFSFDKHFSPYSQHIRFYSIKSLHYVLRDNGFSIISTKYIGRIPPLAKSLFVVAEKN